jgi:hypothetical protein
MGWMPPFLDGIAMCQIRADYSHAKRRGHRWKKLPLSASWQRTCSSCTGRRRTRLPCFARSFRGRCPPVHVGASGLCRRDGGFWRGALLGARCTAWAIMAPSSFKSWRVIASLGYIIESQAECSRPASLRIIPAALDNDPFDVIAGLDPAIHSIEISIGYGSGMDARLVDRA